MGPPPFLSRPFHLYFIWFVFFRTLCVCSNNIYSYIHLHTSPDGALSFSSIETGTFSGCLYTLTQTTISQKRAQCGHIRRGPHMARLVENVLCGSIWLLFDTQTKRFKPIMQFLRHDRANNCIYGYLLPLGWVHWGNGLCSRGTVQRWRLNDRKEDLNIIMPGYMWLNEGLWWHNTSIWLDHFFLVLSKNG